MKSNPHRLSTQQLAVALHVDRRTITRWCVQGCPRDHDGFDLEAVLTWRNQRRAARRDPWIDYSAQDTTRMR